MRQYLFPVLTKQTKNVATCFENLNKTANKLKLNINQKFKKLKKGDLNNKI